MSRQTADVEVNSFIQGLITEAGPLNFPENASIQEKNFVLNRDGSRQRRLGMDYEASYVLKDTGVDITASDIALSSHTWENPNQDGSLDIGVIQVGAVLYFYDINSETVSDNLLNGGSSITLSAADSSSKINTASIRGRLIVACGIDSVLVFSYDKDTDVVSYQDKRLKCRDAFGVHEDIADDFRPPYAVKTEDFTRHAYNLYNQGWPPYIPGGAVESWNFYRDYPVAAPVLQKDMRAMPSNSDLFYTCKVSIATDAKDVGKFDPGELLKNRDGLGPAPKGSYVIDVFKRGEDRKEAMREVPVFTPESTLSIIPQDRTQGYVSNVASYAGRVFYSITETSVVEGDDNTPNIGSLVFYSQVVTADDDLGKCYSKQNPTAEDLNDIVASDGGFVSLPDAGNILSLSPLGNSLFVIADNGVWEIHGGESIFSATNQNVSKTTKIGAISSSSVLTSEEVLSYWAEAGIQIITKDQISLRGKAENITYKTIQGFYEDIPLEAKRNISSVFDPVSRQVRWLYGDSLGNSSFSDKELIFDLTLGAFYTSTISSLAADSPYVAGYLPLRSTIYNTANSNVVVGSDNVVAGSDNVVVSERTIDESVKGSTKYLAFTKNSGDSNWSFTFSHYRDSTFKDWVSKDSVGLDAPASLLTGFLTAGVPSRDKKTPYLITHCRRTEEGFVDDGMGNLTPINESSCLVQAQWEWTDSDAAGRWGRQFQAYRLPRYYGATGGTDPFDYSFTVVTTKNKLRGRGRALSLLFQTEEGKNLHLYGWGHTLNIEAKV